MQPLGSDVFRTQIRSLGNKCKKCEKMQTGCDQKSPESRRASTEMAVRGGLDW